MDKKTKIIGTIGPASQPQAVLEKLISAGLNVVRLNMSHGDHSTHRMTVRNARAAAKKLGQRVGILQDLSGPKIRIGDFETEKVFLEAGETCVLTPKKTVGTPEKMHINYPRLAQEVAPGQAIMLDDGKKKLEVVSIEGEDVVCKIIVGGETKGRRGVNIPGARLSISSITDKDREDLLFGIKERADFIALSFVRDPEDITELRSMLRAHKSDAQIIAKIETQEAVEAIDAIIEAADGIMVARGDLAIEIGAQFVPEVQKLIIRKCVAKGKPVITATQMLESMIHSSVPTRAEVSDVANAIYDGTDAVMLSEETALGMHPVETVRVMADICRQTEAVREAVDRRDVGECGDNPTVDVVGAAAVRAAHAVQAKGIVALSKSGGTARLVARHRPNVPILVLSPEERTCNRMSLVYGATAVHIPQFKEVEGMISVIKATLRKEKYAKRGDRAVVAAGVPFGRSGGTNMMLVITL